MFVYDVSMSKVVFFLGIAVAILFCLYYFGYQLPGLDSLSAPKIKSLVVGDKTIAVEVVETLAAKKRGLSGRSALADNQGMLFVYIDPGNYSFWMKDMKFAIDIIWIGDDHRIVDITKELSPDTFPQTFQPKAPAKYVLEVNSGWADRNLVKIGDLTTF